jgi:hypothetical protein
MQKDSLGRGGTKSISEKIDADPTIIVALTRNR